jgi:hypothetical protein
MNISARSVLMAGVATLTATAVAAAPSVQPPPPRPAPAIQLAATAAPPGQDDPAAPRLLQVLLNDPLRLLGPRVTPGTITAVPPAPIEFAIAPNLADTIDNVYLAVEPWVEYAALVATDILGWVPWVGWLSGQIMVFYRFGEGMVASAAFNIADWLRGDGAFAENLVDFGIDVGLAFAWLGIDEYNYFLPPLPPGLPRPPRPPHEGRPGPSLAALLGLTDTPEVGVANAASDLVNAIYFPVRNTIEFGVTVLQDVLAPIPLVSIVGDQTELLWDSFVAPVADSVVLGLIDPVLNAPLNINSYINGAVTVGSTTVNSLITTGINEVNYILGFPLLSSANAETSELVGTSELSTVPSIAKTPFAASNSVQSQTDGKADVDGSAAGPLREVAKEVRNVRNEIRANFNTATERKAKETGGNGALRSEAEVSGATTKASTDKDDSERSDRPGRVVREIAKVATNVVNVVRDGAAQAVKGAQQEAGDGQAAKNDTDDAEE